MADREPVFARMMAVFIDPRMSGKMDNVIEGKVSEGQFRTAVVWLVCCRLAGTVVGAGPAGAAALLIAAVDSVN